MKIAETLKEKFFRECVTVSKNRITGVVCNVLTKTPDDMFSWFEEELKAEKEKLLDEIEYLKSDLNKWESGEWSTEN